jgi:secreted trypsin-like serine protease
MQKVVSRKNRRLIAIVMALMLIAVSIVPAGAAQFGEPDGDDHPHVGLLVFDVDGSPAWRCSGTLLSPTVMLTAGHCTYGTDGGRVWFEPDIADSDAALEYPFEGETSIEFAKIYTHPDYIDEAFYLYDVGVVILSEPVVLDTYGELAPVGLLDELAVRRGLQDRSFTVVGYGLQSVVPELQQDLVRHQAQVHLIDVRGTAGIPSGTSASFTNNPGQGNGSGGTCFGDSGGPTFHGNSNVIVAVTSYGLNANCAGTGGGYRVDTEGDQEFVNKFLD